MIRDAFLSCTLLIRLFLTRLTSRRHWILATVLFSTLLSLTLSFPRREVWTGDYANVPEAVAFRQKIDAPLENLDVPPGSHESKLTFRLTVPLLANVLRLGLRGCKVVEMLFACALLGLCALLCGRVTGERNTAALCAFSVAATVAGSSGFVEFRMMFDTVALVFLLAAMCSRSPPLVGLFIFLASWTDERALIASPLILIFDAMMKSDSSDSRMLRFLIGRIAFAHYIAWGAYAALRFALAHHFGLVTDTGGVGVDVLMRQLNNLPMGIWSGLEGGWIPVMAGVISLWKRGCRLALALVVIAAISVIGVSMSVMDITRSMAYLLPLLFIGLKALRDSDSKETTYLVMLAAFGLSLLWPNYHVGGESELWWHAPPLPIQIIRTFLFGK